MNLLFGSTVQLLNELTWFLVLLSGLCKELSKSTTTKKSTKTRNCFFAFPLKTSVISHFGEDYFTVGSTVLVELGKSQQPKFIVHSINDEILTSEGNCEGAVKYSYY